MPPCYASVFHGAETNRESLPEFLFHFIRAVTFVSQNPFCWGIHDEVSHAIMFCIATRCAVLVCSSRQWYTWSEKQTLLISTGVVVIGQFLHQFYLAKEFFEPSAAWIGDSGPLSATVGHPTEFQLQNSCTEHMLARSDAIAKSSLCYISQFHWHDAALTN